MKKRTWKTMALLASGGLVLQLAGCGGAIAQLLLQNVIGTVISGVLSVLIGDANNNTV